jgi:hypothetical protein
MRKRISSLLASILALNSVACSEDPHTPIKSSDLHSQQLLPSFAVGFGKQDITTTKILPLGGYGTFFDPFKDKSRKNTLGTHDPLFATAIAFKSPNEGLALTLVSVDSVGLGEHSVKRIREQVKAALPHHNFVLHVSATHAHQTPDTMGLWGNLAWGTGRNSEYMNLMEKGVSKAAIQALQSMTSATLSYAKSSKSNNLTAEPHLSRDDRVTLIAAHDMQGKLIGTLTQWSAHPTVLNEKNNTLSADYVGTFRYYMETKYKGTHVYFNGTLGATYALPSKKMPDPFVTGAKDPDVLDGYEYTAGLGFELFETVEKALATLKPVSQGTLFAMTSAVNLPIDNRLFQMASNLGIVEKKIPNGKTVTETSWFRIGDLQGALVPGEMFASGTNAIRSRMENQGASATLIIGMANDWLGYLMSEQEFKGSRYSYQKTLCPHPKASEQIVEKVPVQKKMSENLF